MKELGIKNIDFWGGEPHFFNDGSKESYSRLNQLRQLIDQHEMSVVVYTPETLAYPYSYSHPEQLVRTRAINYMKQAVEDAVVLNCSKVFINSGCGLRDLSREESFDRMVDSMREITEYALTKNVDIILEQLQPYESNLVIKINDVQRVIDAVNLPNLKICIDVVAMEVANETLKDYFELFGPDKIGLIHFSDSHHFVLGEGENPFPLKQYLTDLEQFGYTGYIDLEINDSIYWLDPHDSVRKSVEWLKSNLV